MRGAPAAVDTAKGTSRGRQRLVDSLFHRDRPVALRSARRYLAMDKRWSPEQIYQALRTQFPDRPETHVVHETVYQAL